MQYLIQVIIYTGVMYLIYLLLLRNKPMHSFNRAYLLACSILPSFIPLLQLPQSLQASLNNVMPLQALPEVFINGSATISPVDNFKLITAAYVSVSIILAGIMLLKLLSIRKVIGKSVRIEKDGYQILLHASIGPGSFGKYIFLPDDEMHDTIICHEQQHIKLKHTADLLWMDVLQIVLWPNLFLVLIKKELKQVHEFQADAHTRFYTGAVAYAELLLSSVFNTSNTPLTHSFIIHPIKRRIIMLQKNSSFLQRTRRALAASVVVAATGAAIIGMQSCKEKAANDVAVSTTGTSAAINGEVYKTAEKMPEFNGNLPTYLGSQIKYPERSKALRQQGRVTVQFTVLTDGSIADAKVVGKEKPDALLCDEALRVVKGMPKWTPGEIGGKKVAVMFTLPIWFKLEPNKFNDGNANTIRTLMNSQFLPGKDNEC